MLRLLTAALAVLFLLGSPAVALADDVERVAADEYPWVAVHRQTALWSNATESALMFGFVEAGQRFEVVEPQNGPRLFVKNPLDNNYAYIDAVDVGPSARPEPVAQVVDAGTPSSQEYIFWRGMARVTMYTCFELGGCNYTASGIWPYEGVVAVDPRLIPLGSSVWVDGLGIFLAADTGSAVRGSHIDVYVNDYGRAIQWGIQYLEAAAFFPS